LNLKAEVESSISHFSFKSLVPGGFNSGFIGTTCTASRPLVAREVFLKRDPVVAPGGRVTEDKYSDRGRRGSALEGGGGGGGGGGGEEDTMSVEEEDIRVAGREDEKMQHACYHINNHPAGTHLEERIQCRSRRRT
jgi:hypothetical protein